MIRVDYRIGGRFFFRKFLTQEALDFFLMKNHIKEYTISDSNGGLLGG